MPTAIARRSVAKPNNHLPGVLAPGSDVAMAVVLRNMSDAPVYNVIIACVGISGAGPNAKGEDNGHDYPCRACVGILPPGTWYAWLPTNGPGMHVRTAPEAAFTDANGRSWVRRGNGKLEEIEAEPVSIYLWPWSSCELGRVQEAGLAQGSEVPLFLDHFMTCCGS